MDRSRPRPVDGPDGARLDLATAASRGLNADAFLDFMHREWARIQDERQHPQYLPCRSEEDAAWFLAKWGPGPDGPQ